MPVKARLALGTIALCALVLLPFVARFFTAGPTSRTPSTLSDVTLLIRRQQFQPAYDLLSRRTPGPEGTTLHQYRLAVCERALGLADSAYARLLRLEGATPLLEGYRRLWLARSLEMLATSTADSSAAISG
jgi:hypothetical protein